VEARRARGQPGAGLDPRRPATPDRPARCLPRRCTPEPLSSLPDPVPDRAPDARHAHRRAAAPRDQAHESAPACLPAGPRASCRWCTNPHVSDTGVVMERLCAAFGVLRLAHAGGRRRRHRVAAARTGTVDWQPASNRCRPRCPTRRRAAWRCHYLDGRRHADRLSRRAASAARRPDVVCCTPARWTCGACSSASTPLTGAAAGRRSRQPDPRLHLDEAAVASAWGRWPTTCGSPATSRCARAPHGRPARRLRRPFPRRGAARPGAGRHPGAAARAAADDLRALAAGLVAPSLPVAPVNGLAELARADGPPHAGAPVRCGRPHELKLSGA